jgi:hypothetical protein
MKPPRHPGSAEIGPAGRAVRGRCEPRIATSAPRTRGREHALPRFGEIPEALVRLAVGNHGAERNTEHQVVAILTVAVGALPVCPSLGAVVATVVKVEQRGEGGVGFQVHAAAGSAVTAVGPAVRDVLLLAEADAARAAGATLDVDVDLVDEGGHDR